MILTGKIKDTLNIPTEYAGRAPAGELRTKLAKIYLHGNSFQMCESYNIFSILCNTIPYRNAHLYYIVRKH